MHTQLFCGYYPGQPVNQLGTGGFCWSKVSCLHHLADSS